MLICKVCFFSSLLTHRKYQYWAHAKCFASRQRVRASATRNNVTMFKPLEQTSEKFRQTTTTMDFILSNMYCRQPGIQFRKNIYDATTQHSTMLEQLATLPNASSFWPRNIVTLSRKLSQAPSTVLDYLYQKRLKCGTFCSFFKCNVIASNMVQNSKEIRTFLPGHATIV